MKQIFSLLMMGALIAVPAIANAQTNGTQSDKEKEKEVPLKKRYRNGIDPFSLDESYIVLIYNGSSQTISRLADGQFSQSSLTLYWESQSGTVQYLGELNTTADCLQLELAPGVYTIYAKPSLLETYSGTLEVE